MALQHDRLAIQNKLHYRVGHSPVGGRLRALEQSADAMEQFARTLTPEDDRPPGFLYSPAAACARTGNREKALQYAGEARQCAALFGHVQLGAGIDRSLHNLERVR